MEGVAEGLGKELGWVGGILGYAHQPEVIKMLGWVDPITAKDDALLGKGSGGRGTVVGIATEQSSRIEILNPVAANAIAGVPENLNQVAIEPEEFISVDHNDHIFLNGGVGLDALGRLVRPAPLAIDHPPIRQQLLAYRSFSKRHGYCLAQPQLIAVLIGAIPDVDAVVDVEAAAAKLPGKHLEIVVVVDQGGETWLAMGSNKGPVLISMDLLLKIGQQALGLLEFGMLAIVLDNPGMALIEVDRLFELLLDREGFPLALPPGVGPGCEIESLMHPGMNRNREGAKVFIALIKIALKRLLGCDSLHQAAKYLIETRLGWVVDAMHQWHPLMVLVDPIRHGDVAILLPELQLLNR